jgi:hypothetical protein
MLRSKAAQVFLEVCLLYLIVTSWRHHQTKER